ncbi:dTDP-4-dehydrorhamnose reductase [Hoylesella nanceiensis]|uniref:dTDP-4-dehydrorhamnose reductase n=1 Tax=Hoylesella nanceiensis TaxID=425941 RepID=UPI001CB4B08D|nr:dTDP-4-dehydrorhamnose reductase [Hoylesella nanceiensis]MBF1427668.1 dTDP-4-dehydrorhamnose reductase [Hoylesella nanceiensis]MBF1428561.1 dTDP-4-dehydrorhamnose reductase [Hoylesella nanceiensis]
MRILVTGSNGQLGSEMVALQPQETHHQWFNLDINELDITDKNAVEQFVVNNKIDGIINCAAYTNVDKAEEDVALCYKVNRDAPQYLAQAIEKVGGFIIHISTDYVFDGTNNIPYTEQDKPNPVTIYGKSKIEGEQYVCESCKQHIIIRTAWVYSSYGKNFVKTMIKLGEEKPSLGVIFDQIGSPTYARDLAKAIITIVNQGIKPGIYNFSNEGVISWYDFTKHIHQLANITSCKVAPIHTADYPTLAQRPHFSVLDKTKIKNTYNIEIPYWRDSLEECIQLLEQQKKIE